LDRRSIRGDLIETYRILNGIYNIPWEFFSVWFRWIKRTAKYIQKNIWMGCEKI